MLVAVWGDLQPLTPGSHRNDGRQTPPARPLRARRGQSGGAIATANHLRNEARGGASARFVPLTCCSGAPRAAVRDTKRCDGAMRASSHWLAKCRFGEAVLGLFLTGTLKSHILIRIPYSRLQASGFPARCRQMA